MRSGDSEYSAYLVGDEATGEGLVIDPADEPDLLLSEADSHGLRIKYIVNTHSHVDHIMGNQEIVKRTKAKIAIHEKDADRLTRTPSYLLDMFDATPSPPADLLVKEGDVIRVGDVETPGHPYPGPFPRRNLPLQGRDGFHRRHALCRFGGTNRFAGSFP